MEVLKAPRRRFTALADLPCYGDLVAGFDDGLTYIYSNVWNHGVTWGELPPQGGVTGIAVFSETRLAISYNDSYVRFYDIKTSKHLGITKVDNGYVNALAVLNDNRHIAFGANDGKIYLWNTLTQDYALEWFASLDAGIRCLTALPYGALASGSDDGVIKVWDPTTWDCQYRIQAHKANVTCLAALPDGRLASSSNDGTVCVWFGDDLDCSMYIEADKVDALAVLLGGCLAGGGGDGSIYLWKTASAGFLAHKVLTGHKDRVTAMTVLADGRLASASLDGTIRVWDV